MPLSGSSNAQLRETNSISRSNRVCSPNVPCWFVFCLLAIFSISAVAQQNRPIDKAEAQREEAAVAEARPADGQVSEADKTEDPASSDDYTPFGVDFAAIVLIAHQDKVDPEPDVPGEKVKIDPEIPVPEGLAEGLQKYIGKPISAGILADLAKEIILAWRETDHPLVDVYFPEQNVTKGKIQIVVRESVLGEIKVENAKHTRTATVKRQIPLESGDRINQKTIQSGLAWLNENPVRRANVIFEKGEADGTSDIVFQSNDKKNVSLYSGFANTGLTLTGENEFTAGVNIANPFKTEQSIGYNYNGDIDFDSLAAHTVFYQAWLPWRHKLRLVGAYVSSEAAAGDESFPLDLMGENIQGTGEYEIPLDAPNYGAFEKLRHSLIFGIDYKSTNTNLIFGGLDIFDSKAAVFQYRAEYDATLPDKLGYTKLNLSSVWAPGSVFQDNDDEAFEALREGSTADYWYGIAELERGFRLPADFNLILRGTGQTTGSRLISTEQLLAGGYRSVRGFDENLIRGDTGGIVNVELISPEISILPALEDKWNILGFYDAAALRETDAEDGASSHSLQSAGVGVRLRVNENIFARAAYGWALDAHGFEDVDLKDGKMHFGMTVRY